MNKLKLSRNQTFELIAICAAFLFGYYSQSASYLFPFAIGWYLGYKL